jgi:hypothetical protein
MLAAAKRFRARGGSTGVPFGEEMPVFSVRENKKPWEYFVFDPSARYGAEWLSTADLTAGYAARWYLKGIPQPIYTFTA